ncbi:CIS tube protein, partial [Ramlibacter alkalitolerans]
MAWLPDAPTVASATFKVLEGTGAGRPPFDVQFNPASLEYTITNEFDDRNGNNGARQFVKKSSAKLTMTLVFDTTETGASVRDVTANIAGLLEPAKDGSKKFAPKVEFGWGSYSFKGVVEQFKETLDFFSATGVPLRSSINLTLGSQDVEFQSNRNPAPAVDRSAQPEPVAAPPGRGAADVAS